MEMHPVSSTNIQSYGYDQEKSELYINFHKTGLYIYEDVSEEFVEAFLNAKSKGIFVREHLKNYKFRKEEK